jgi:hypothetical protein
MPSLTQLWLWQGTRKAVLAIQDALPKVPWYPSDSNHAGARCQGSNFSSTMKSISCGGPPRRGRGDRSRLSGPTYRGRFDQSAQALLGTETGAGRQHRCGHGSNSEASAVQAPPPPHGSPLLRSRSFPPRLLLDRKASPCGPPGALTGSLFLSSIPWRTFPLTLPQQPSMPSGTSSSASTRRACFEGKDS